MKFFLPLQQILVIMVMMFVMGRMPSRSATFAFTIGNRCIIPVETKLGSRYHRLFQNSASSSAGIGNHNIATNRRFNARIVARGLSASSKATPPQIEISPSDHNTSPLKDYASAGAQQTIDPRIVKALKKQNITQPTPIQAYGIPLLQQGHDVMATAQTGSGKTLAFSIPLLERLLQNNGPSSSSSSSAPLKAIILNPTRELAIQTASAIQDLLGNIPNGRQIKVALATGGESVSQQRSQVKTANIVVATPGRLLQFIDERTTLSLRSVQDLIADESDRMVDLGFEEQLRRIAQALNRNNNDRRTVLCSATFPPEVQRIAADFMKPDYYFIAVGRVGEAPTSIEQKLLWVDGGPGERRRVAVREIRAFLDRQQILLRKANMSQGQDTKKAKGTTQEQSQVIVFCNTKDEAEAMGAAIRNQVAPNAKVVTGDKDQKERNQSLEAFRQGKVPILIATDVAARGLDVPTIGLVVQVDVPRDSDTFVHRAGRTGRAGSKGKAIALMDGRSMGVAPALVELLQEAHQEVPSWLLGMSYVSRARSLEEEGAIAAGGGSLMGTIGTSGGSDGSSSSAGDSSFSQQDFRSNAAAGSWGSERDTSYRDFDSDAYSDGASDAGSFENFDDIGDEEGVDDDMDDDMDDDNGFSVSMSSDLADGDNSDSEENPMSRDVPSPFRRQEPSYQLREFLKRQTGKEEIGDSPVPDFLSKLSRRGSDQRLRFEYMGMFPFEAVSENLIKRNQGEDSSSNNVPRILMVAEKPSIAKAIADALSGPRGARQTRGISRALPVYEFTTRGQVPSQFIGDDGKSNPCRILVTSVVGHVFSLGFDRDENQGKIMDPQTYFHMPVVKQTEDSTNKLRVVDHLRALAAECDHLVLWLDCDAEGENIAHEVIGVTRHAMEKTAAKALQANRDAAPQKRVHRAQFSAITNEALQDAFRNLGEPDAALSRADAIESFKPKEFWKVHIAAKTPDKRDKPLNLRWLPPAGGTVEASREGARKGAQAEESATFDKSAAQRMISIASKPNSVATVVDVESISEKLNAPLALNTVALLAAGSKAMGMSPKKVMSVAEKLYGGGYLSYPRTETSRYDPKGFDVRSLLRDFSSHPQFGPTASYLLRNKYSQSGRPPLRGKDAGDHPPITCLKPATHGELDGAEWRVYEFVVRTFLGSLSDDLLFTRQVVKLDLNGSDETCALEQIHVDSLGFAGACPWVLSDIGAQSKDKNGNRVDPIHFQKGMQLPITNVKLEHCHTRPPRFLQEHELIQRMDENRIGTDASMAVHVTNIVSRGYVVLCDETGTLLRPPRPPRPGQKPLPRQIGRYLVPTSLGCGLIDLFNNGCKDEDEISPALLARPAIRAQMEEEVKLIANGKLDKEECVEKNLAWFEARYQELFESLSKQRIQKFGNSLSPTRDSLRYWRKLGAFEEPTLASQQANSRPSNNKQGKRGGPKGRTGTSSRHPTGNGGKQKSSSSSQQKHRQPGHKGKAKPHLKGSQSKRRDSSTTRTA